MTTPRACESSRSSSASAGDRLATVAPRNGERAPLTNDPDLRAAAQRLGGEVVIERVGVVDRHAVDADDEIAGPQAGARGRTVGGHARHQRATRPSQAEAICNLRRDLLQ